MIRDVFFGLFFLFRGFSHLDLRDGAVARHPQRDGLLEIREVDLLGGTAGLSPGQKHTRRARGRKGETSERGEADVLLCVPPSSLRFSLPLLFSLLDGGVGRKGRDGPSRS